jgi:hypothetical protein
MRKKGGSRQGTMSLNSINEEGSREPLVGKICLEVTWQSVVIPTQVPTIAQRMMMWKMTHICHLPRLVLMEKDWQVLVAVGQQEMRNRLKRKKMMEMVMMELRVMMMRRMKKFLMLKRSTPLPIYTWELQFSSYPSTRIGGRKSATRTRQIWWGKRGKKIWVLLRKN